MELIPKNTSTLCLNMIVKNESKIITRLLDSVCTIIDCYCICDTGSTDDTIEVVTSYFKNKNIAGKIVSEPFKNFCYNRNYALQSCIGMSDYVLLMDADMVLEIGDFDKNILSKASQFTFLQGTDSFFYQNLRIIQNNGLYNYVGVTHEYIDTPHGSTNVNLSKQHLFIRDIGDGGSKTNKYERDILLLTDGIKEDPTNVRYHFYLANSYYDSGRFSEAIDFYKKRIEFGGWKEEVWYSYYRIGHSYKNIGKIECAISSWMDGFQYYDERLEGLYEVIKHYRIISKHRLANMFYQQAREVLDLNKKRDIYLFLENDVYTNKLYYEYTIFSAYLGVKNINDEVIKILNNTKDYSVTNSLLSNMKFYKDILIPVSKTIMDDSLVCNINGDPTKFTSSSSCMIPVEGGYHMNVRYVNYDIQENGAYLNCDRYIISINKCIQFDRGLNVVCEKWQQLVFDDRRYIGIEDVKIFTDVHSNEKKTLFIGTGYHKSNQIGIVTGEYDTISCKMDYFEVSPDFNQSSCEKNWVFVDYNGDTHVIYEWHPLRICKIDSSQPNSVRSLSLVETKKMPTFFSRIRGSSCGYKYVKDKTDNSDKSEYELWFVTHLVSYESPRHYYHVIVVFNENMDLLRYSAPFKFEGDSIEYCLSIIVEEERVLMNYSTWDRTTRIGIYDKKYIDSIVKYV